MKLIQSVALFCVLFGPHLAVAQQPAHIGAEAQLDLHPHSHYSRYLNWRPADGVTETLNPPRFSWPFRPDWPENWNDALHTYRLQIADNREMNSPVVDVQTPLNFYNALPVLDPQRQWYWHAGYDVGTDREHWSAVQSFRIARDAVVWDRQSLASGQIELGDHPRILFTSETLDRVRKLAQTNGASAAALDHIRRDAERIMQKPWWDKFPETDRLRGEPEQEFYTIAEDLVTVCFAWMMTGEDKYAGVKSRAVQWASYPPAGRSSPERLGGGGMEDATQGTEFLALLFDWLYQDITQEERQIMIESLEWRVDHIMNHFAWRSAAERGPTVSFIFFDGDGEQISTERLSARSYRPFYAGSSDDWRQVGHDQPVPPGAEKVRIRLENREVEGTVEWDRIALATDASNEELLINSDFSRTEASQPAGWRFEGAGPVFEAAGGESGNGAVAIRCNGDEKCGGWEQTVSLPEANMLYLNIRYRTAVDEILWQLRSIGLAAEPNSHHFESAMDTAPAGIALWGHSDVGEQWLNLVLNWIIGVTSSHGFDEAWSEGAGYGTSKSKWLANASLYLDTAMPDLNLGKNPVFGRIGQFFTRLVPVGMPHHAWGNQAHASFDNQRATFRKFAYMTGEGFFLYNWKMLSEDLFSDFRPWIEYVLPAHYERPEPLPESEPNMAFPIAGWATAASGPPSDPNTYEQGIGIVFQSRPTGGYSHSFNSDGSFILHAYGQMLNHGGGSSGNQDVYAFHTMSHNTILVDGLGQAQTIREQSEPWYSRLLGYKEGSDYVYFSGDITHAYPKKPDDFRRFGFSPGDIYRKKALPYLDRFERHILFVDNRYFVIYDDLKSEKPATFTWLYHIRPDNPLDFTESNFRIDYSVGDVNVRLQHIAHPQELEMEDRSGIEALVNPITGEDYSKSSRFQSGHSLWINNREPATSWNYLTVVFPAPPGKELPQIERLDNHSVRVDGDVITFDSKGQWAGHADYVVDIAAVRKMNH